MPNSYKLSFGFHLIEILITLAIISILSTLSIPIYSQYIAHERRLEAASILAHLAIALEEFQIENNTYQSATLKKLKFPEHIASNNYQLTIASATIDEYLITAKPINRQSEIDKSCGTLLLNSQGEKSISGTGMLDECW